MGVETYASGGVETILQVITDVGSVFSSVWTFLISNWGLFVFIAVPIFVFVLASIIGIWVHR